MTSKDTQQQLDEAKEKLREVQEMIQQLEMQVQGDPLEQINAEPFLGRDAEQGDEGKQVVVRDEPDEAWSKPRNLCGVIRDKGSTHPYEVYDDGGYLELFAEAKIYQGPSQNLQWLYTDEVENLWNILDNYPDHWFVVKFRGGVVGTCTGKELLEQRGTYFDYEEVNPWYIKKFLITDERI